MSNLPARWGCVMQREVEDEDEQYQRKKKKEEEKCL
jgi:hypothetical protein